MKPEQDQSVKVEDSILIAVMTKYHERALNGLQKYGTTLDRNDIDLIGWLNHLQDELMDATLYLERIKKELKPITRKKFRDRLKEEKQKQELLKENKISAYTKLGLTQAEIEALMPAPLTIVPLTT